MRAGAGFVVLLGLLMFLAAFDDERLEDERLLRQSDAVCGISTGNVLEIAGLVHLAAGAYLVIIRDNLTRVLVVFWLSSVSGVYRLGIGWLNVYGGFPMVTLLAHKVGISARMLGLAWGWLLAALMIGALGQLELLRQQRKREKNAKFLEQWRENREAKALNGQE